MGYSLKPNNKKLKPFDFGAFSFPVLLGACGYLFESYHGQGIENGSWEMLIEPKDKRYVGKMYPPILCNDGFEVTAFEAKVMGVCALNFSRLSRGKIRNDFLDLFEEFSVWVKESKGFKIF